MKKQKRRSGNTQRRIKGQPRTIRSESRAAKIIKLLAVPGNLAGMVCEVVGISRTAYYTWRREDEAFNQACEDAEEHAVDILEAEAWKRATVGVDKPVTYQGVVMDTFKEKSDGLMSLLLRGRRRKVFGDDAANVTVNVSTGEALREARERLKADKESGSR